MKRLQLTYDEQNSMARKILDFLETTGLFVIQSQDPPPTEQLTPTEREILKLLAQGYASKEIAAQRHLSLHTVATHRKNLFRKLGVSSVQEATRLALRAGLVDLAEYYI
jgi:two-component system, NarL family, response regulator LiaR